MYIKGRCIVSACALLFFQQAMAAGMDCAKAVSAVENAVCADKGLYALDTQMGATYSKLMRSMPDEKAELKSTQRLWLKDRNQCAEDVSCLNQRYRERLESLQAQWIDTLAYSPDEIDKQVMAQLQQRIEAARKVDPEFALEKTLDAFTVNLDTTSFAGIPDDDEQTHFPETIPNGVSQDEWKALTASSITGAADTGQTTYILTDLDGDGLRDLIVETYSGGTGLFSYTETWRGTGTRFTRRGAKAAPEANAETTLFYTNDRGANQAVNWIRVHGKIYAAYRDSAYGVDKVYLLNPLQINRQVPTITVQYRYQLNVPRTQANQDNPTAYELEPAVQKALTQGLAKIGNNQTTSSKPICPIPASGPGDEDYYSYGASYYAIEPVADVPVILGDDCFIARLINWYGTYDEKDGLFAQLTLRKPGSEEQAQSYTVNGRRHITQVSTSIGKAEGGAAN
ncbi:MAG: lysozyme inhibitor LprI family protein [Pseudomonas sp.]